MVVFFIVFILYNDTITFLLSMEEICIILLSMLFKITSTPSKNQFFKTYANLADASREATIKQTYKNMHEQQTLEKVAALKSNYGALKIGRFTIWEMIEQVGSIIDDSDPDTEAPQLTHFYQTVHSVLDRYFIQDGTNYTFNPEVTIKSLFSDAEWDGLPPEIRKTYENTPTLSTLYSDITDWNFFILIAFLHDIGKVLVTEDFGSLPQHLVVGDTFVVGTPFSESNVFYKEGFYQANPDLVSNTGGYTPRCGFRNANISWGHDEYAFMVLTQALAKMSPADRKKHGIDALLYVLRFHSFYPWHTPRVDPLTSKQKPRGYTPLASDVDWRRLPLVKALQKADLYSKQRNTPDEATLRPLMERLIDKFLPEKYDW